MKRVMSSLLVLGMITVMLSAVVGSAGAQASEPSGQVTVVNGTASDVVARAVPEEGPPIALGGTLAPGDTGDPTILLPGVYEVRFLAGTSTVASHMLTVGPVEAWNIVAIEGNPNATAYPIDLSAKTPIATVANSSAGDVTMSPPDQTLSVEDLKNRPDMNPFTLTPASGSSVLTVNLSSAGPTAYTMVVAVGDINAVIVTIDNLDALKTELEGPTPPPTTVPPTTVPPTTVPPTTVPPTTVPPTTIPPVTEVEVPNVVGQTEADAISAIMSEGLVAASSEEPSDDVPNGSVIAQDPVGGSEVVAGSTVDIAVSTGPDAPAVVPVPDVVGEDVVDAQATLEAEGFVVQITEESNETVEVGLVTEMNPAAGTEVAEGTTVVLAVSTGPGDVVVPDFSGMTISEATAAAEGVALTITFVEDPNKPDPGGIVVAQNPEEGTTAEAGSEVVAQLSPAFDDAWTILVVDNDRELTVTGINFKLNTTTVSTVVDTTLSRTTGVGTSGSWSAKIDISELDESEHFLQVTGIAADGSDYEQMFTIPAAGQSTDQPDSTEAGGFPWWGWAIIGLLIVAVVAIAVKVSGGSSGDDGSATGGTGTVPPPPPPAAPAPTSAPPTESSES
jgi:beta-lactam-binding protein with PASTA domain